MNYKRMKLDKMSQVHVEDSRGPSAILNLDGRLIQVNDLFIQLFRIGKLDNIKKLLDETTGEMWNKFTDIAKNTGRISFYLPMQVGIKKLHTVKIQLFYCNENNYLIASFKAPHILVKEVKISYLDAFRKSDNFMIIMDKTGIIRDVNEQCNTFFNLNREFFIDKHIDVLINLFPGSSHEITNYIRTVTEQGFYETLKQYERTPGDIRHYHVATFYDNETRVYFTRMTDQTDKINLEERLAHEDTLSSVGQLAASIAHEIRNPMTTLKGFTQLLRVSATEESKRYLTVIDDEIIRMEAILSEMLILSKPSTNEKDTISLQKILSDLIRVIQPKANLEGIIIRENENVSVEDSIFGDMVKLKQAFFNLFKNALEAMPLGGELIIDINRTKDGQVNLTISDTGNGIDASKMNRIFMPYFTTRAEGTGLGLAFVLKTMDDHGATITVESEVNVGTKFIISFPSAIAVKVERESSSGEKVLSKSGRNFL